MKHKEGMLPEEFEATPASGVSEAWIAVLDRVIAGLMFAVVVTLCIPLCSMLYR